MLLVEIDISGTTYRVSFEDISNLTNPWLGYISKLNPPQLNIKKPYGGYIELKASGFELDPKFFIDYYLWPPTRELDVRAYYSATTQEAKELLFEATAHRKKNYRTEIKYKFYTPSYTTTLAKTTALAGTMATNFATWATTLGLTLNTDAARTVSPAVDHTTAKEWLLIDAMSDMAAFFTHCFYIKDGVLYLIDMLKDNGSRTITEFDIFPSSYPTPDPIASAATANYVRYSSKPYGKKITGLTEWHGTEANINTALDDIISVSNVGVMASVKLTTIGTLPTPMEQITLLDESLGQSSTIVFNPSKIRYDFNPSSETITVSGGGVLTDGQAIIFDGDSVTFDGDSVTFDGDSVIW